MGHVPLRPREDRDGVLRGPKLGEVDPTEAGEREGEAWGEARGEEWEEAREREAGRFGEGERLWEAGKLDVKPSPHLRFGEPESGEMGRDEGGLWRREGGNETDDCDGASSSAHAGFEGDGADRVTALSVAGGALLSCIFLAARTRLVRLGPASSSIEPVARRDRQGT